MVRICFSQSSRLIRIYLFFYVFHKNGCLLSQVRNASMLYMILAHFLSAHWHHTLSVYVMRENEGHCIIIPKRRRICYHLQLQR